MKLKIRQHMEYIGLAQINKKQLSDVTYIVYYIFAAVRLPEE